MELDAWGIYFLGTSVQGMLNTLAMHSRCFDVCRCRVGHVISGDQKRCLKAANTVGEICAENSQCQAFMTNSECRDGHVNENFAEDQNGSKKQMLASAKGNMTAYESRLLSLHSERIGQQIRFEEERHQKQLEVLEEEILYWRSRRTNEAKRNSLSPNRLSLYEGSV